MPPSIWPATQTGDVIKFSVVGNLFNQEIVTSFYLRQRANRLLGDVVTEFEAADTGTGPKGAYLTPLTAQYVIDHYALSDVYPGVNPQAKFTPTVGDLANAGGQGSLCEAPAVSAVVGLKTIYRGQGNRGRIFFPAIGQDKYVDGLITSAFQAILQANVHNLINYYNYIDGGPRPGDRSDYGLWRTHLQRVPSGVLGAQLEPFFNPLLVPSHVDHRPNYQYKPGDKALSLQPLAFVNFHGLEVNTVLRVQRRREIGVHITRSHRV